MKQIAVWILFLMTYGAHAQESDIIAIERASHTFSYLLVQGQYDSLLNMYTSDAKIFPNNQEILEGDQLREYWIPKDESYQVTYHKAVPKGIRVWGDEAYDWGYYEGKSVANGEESSWKGKYVIIWRKENNAWKMYLDIWNRVEN